MKSRGDTHPALGWALLLVFVAIVVLACRADLPMLFAR